jgi:hypothetical protein
MSGGRWAVPWLIGLSWLALAGYVLGRFANDAFPTYYLFRPLLAAIPFAVVIGLVARAVSPTQAPFIAAALAGFLAGWSAVSRYLIPLAMVLVGWLVIRWVVQSRGRSWPLIPRVASTVATVFVLVFFVVGLGRAVLTFEGPIDPVVATEAATGPNLYLLMLDAYPRSDTTLNDFGFDNEPFQEALEERGFDVYRDSMSDRRNTDYTLLGLLNGSLDGVPPDTDLSQEGQWERRRQLSEAALPIEAREAGYEYWVIDSPSGFVTFTAGNHIQNGAMNDLEEYMLATSAVGPVVAAVWPTLPTDSQRDHLDASLDSLISLADPNAHRLVLAHLFGAHLPFQWDAEGNPRPVESFWPGISMFVWQLEDVPMELDEYAERQRGNLTTLNPKLLATVDEIVARDPGAVIVLVSDHGSRYAFEFEDTEWYRNFLAARTPDHPQLFASDPSPTHLLRTLLSTYVTDGSD